MLSEILARVPDECAVLELLRRYDRLLKKYSHILNYEDAYNDLVLFFIELIQGNGIKNVCYKDEKIIVNYIVTSIRNHSLKLIKRRKLRITPMSSLSDEQCYAIESKMSYIHDEPLSHYWSSGLLTEAEEKVLRLYFEFGYSISDIAEMTKTSRQSVNQTKIRALNKLRNKIKSVNYST